jgi:hypothetical protein
MRRSPGVFFLLGCVIVDRKGDLFTDLEQQLLQIQHELFDCGPDLASETEYERGGKVFR